MPHSLKVLVFKIWQFILFWSQKILIFRTPEMFIGPGSSLQLVDHIAKTGVRKVLIVTDAMLVKIGLLKPMQEKLQQLGVEAVVYDGVQPNPTIEQIETGLAMLKKELPDIVIGAGTVLTKEQMKQSIDAGADFLVTPGTPPAPKAPSWSPRRAASGSTRNTPTPSPTSAPIRPRPRPTNASRRSTASCWHSSPTGR